jgi:hypothetical protein
MQLTLTELESAWFQPLKLKRDILVSSLLLFKCNLYRYALRFIGHFVSVYEQRAPPFARESARWSLDEANVRAYTDSAGLYKSNPFHHSLESTLKANFESTIVVSTLEPEM